MINAKLAFEHLERSIKKILKEARVWLPFSEKAITSSTLSDR
ncbi:hypothetical protein [Trichocoleus sp. FACHB-832]|nr:hypothetical protein [Trichocoleus sp. FACHB-832]